MHIGSYCGLRLRTKKLVMNLNQLKQFNLLGNALIQGVLKITPFLILAVTTAAHAAPVTIPDLQKNKNTAPPNAGQILQEIERDKQAKPAEQLPAPEAAPADDDANADKVTVKTFKFEGNHAVTNEQLEDQLAPLLNRAITIKELKTSLDIVANYYRDNGYLAVASLPEQDITEGVVILNIVEAKFGGVKLDGEYGKDYKRVRPSVVERYINAASPKGELLNQNKLDRGLGLLQRIAGFTLDANYQAGATDGTSELLVKVKDKPLFSGSLLADNSGGRNTGWDKQTAVLSLASPTGFGDTFSITALNARGTKYGSLDYKVPVGAHGLQLGVNGSYLEYEFILPLEGGLTPFGRSTAYGVDASYPVFLNRTTSLIADLHYDEKVFTNRTTQTGDVATVNDYKVSVVSLQFSGNHFDNFLAGAQNSASIDFGYGKVNMDNSPGDSKANDKSGSNTQGYYGRIKWNLSRNQFITDTISLNLDLSGQTANRNLDSSEKFYLGGINGVRGYPTSEGSGSDGYLAKLELRKFLPYNFNVSGFVDSGYIRQYHITSTVGGDPLPSTATSPNAYHLEGYGASLAWNGPYQSAVKLTYATRFGKNPNPVTDTHLDQNGLLEKHVVWVNGSVSF